MKTKEQLFANVERPLDAISIPKESPREYLCDFHAVNSLAWLMSI